MHTSHQSLVFFLACLIIPVPWTAVLKTSSNLSATPYPQITVAIRNSLFNNPRLYVLDSNHVSLSCQASKAAVSAFFETLRLELGSDVPITVFLPGVVKSDMTDGKAIQPSGEFATGDTAVRRRGVGYSRSFFPSVSILSEKCSRQGQSAHRSSRVIKSRSYCRVHCFHSGRLWFPVVLV